jgi:hypothetical protein
MIMLHPIAAEVTKPVGMFGSGFLAIKQLSQRSSKQNGRMIDDRRSTRGNRFATDDRATNKGFVGLSDGPPVLEGGFCISPRKSIFQTLPGRDRRCGRRFAAVAHCGTDLDLTGIIPALG